MLDLGLWVASVPVPFVQASMPSLPSAIFTNPDRKERHVYFCRMMDDDPADCHSKTPAIAR